MVLAVRKRWGIAGGMGWHGRGRHCKGGRAASRTTAGTAIIAAAAGVVLTLAVAGSGAARDRAPPVVPYGDGHPITGGRHDIVVFDGDTFQLNGVVIQLAGINAPELGQLCGGPRVRWRCGLTAAYELRKRLQLAPQRIRCWPYGRVHAALVASCLIGSEDLSQVSLANGLAVALPGAPFNRWVDERKARQAGLGVWRGAFVPPWQWRREMEAALAKGETPAGCVIKGVINGNGERLYYGPLDDDYHSLQANRPFCSDDGARDAGWRRPGEPPWPAVARVPAAKQDGR